MATIRMVRIVPQVVMVEGEETLVECKRILFYPYTDGKTGETKFGLLRYPSAQVCINRANWPADNVVKVKFYPHNGKFRILFNTQLDAYDPWDRHWEPGKYRTVINQSDYLNTDQVEEQLGRICKAADPSKSMANQPVDMEFIHGVLEMMVEAAESPINRKKTA